MYSHRQRTRITESREVTLRLPDDFPAGDVEVIVLAEDRLTDTTPQDRVRALGEWIARLPAAAPVALEALDRGDWYR